MVTLSEWFENNYASLGFTSIRCNCGTPDYTCITGDGKEVGVELEIKSSSFIRHNHDPRKVDLVVCVDEDVKLPVKTIETNIPSIKAEITPHDKRRRLEELASVLDGELRDAQDIRIKYNKTFNHNLSRKMILLNLLELRIWVAEGRINLKSKIRCTPTSSGYLFWKEEE